MSPVIVVIAAIASYFIGTIPSAIVVARAKGVDITTFGSGNPGASNVARHSAGNTARLSLQLMQPKAPFLPPSS